MSLFSLLFFRGSTVLVYLLISQLLLFSQQTPKTFLVKFKKTNSSSSRTDHFDQANNKLLKAIPSLELEVWQSNRSLEELRQSGKGEIEWIEEDQLYSAQFIPNDTELPRQWNLRYDRQYSEAVDASIQASPVWENHKGSKNVKIAHIDSGVDWTHPDLIDNIWQNLGEDLDGDGQVLEWNGSQWIFDPDDEDGIDSDGNGYADDFIGWDFVNNDNDPQDDHLFGHGTHVAGIMAARGNNEIGIAGISWYASIMVLKFLDHNGNGKTSHAIEALAYAKMMGADLTQNSWGGGAFSQALLDAIQASSIPFVTAAGNNYGNDNDMFPLFPASYQLPEIIAVAGSDFNDEIANFSNTGRTTVDLVAPGLGIYSTLPNNLYGFLSGTSMAAPHVSGALSLQIAENPGAGLDVLKSNLLKAVDQKVSYRGTSVAQGRLNLSKLFSQTTRFQAVYPFSNSRHLTASGLVGNEAAMAFSNHQEIVLNWANSNGNSTKSLRRNIGNTVQDLALCEINPSQVWLSEEDNQGTIIHAIDKSNEVLWSRQFQDLKIWRLLTLSRGTPYLIASQADVHNKDNILIGELNMQGEVISAQLLDLNMDRITKLVALPLQNGFAIACLGEMNNQEQLWTAYWSRQTDDDEEEDDDDDYEDDEEDDDLDDDDEEGAGIRWQHEINLPGQMPIDTLAILSGQDAGEWQLLFVEDRPDRSDLYSFSFDDEGEILQKNKLKFPFVSSPYTFAKTTGRTFLVGGQYNHQNHSGFWLGSVGGNDQLLWGELYSEVYDALLLDPVTNSGYNLLANDQQNFPVFIGTDAQGKNPCSQSLLLNLEIASLNGNQLLRSNVRSSNTVINSTLLNGNWVEHSLNTNQKCQENFCGVNAIIKVEDVQTCPGGTLNFENLSIGASGYTWILDGEVVSNSTQFSHTFGAEGKYWVELIASNNNCSDKTSLEIEVDEAPKAELDDVRICANRLELDLLEPGWTYVWRDEDSEQVISTNSQVVIDYSGKFEVQVLDECGNEDKTSFRVNLEGDCVWPGDVNGDRAVNTLDFLLLGMANGTQGPTRPQASIDFTAQQAPNWSSSFGPQIDNAYGRNFKHADTDGNGFIEIESDKQAIESNVRNPSKSITSIVRDDLEVFLQTDNIDIFIGSIINFDIVLQGAAGANIEDVYGISFQLKYNIPLQIAPLLRKSNSWLSNDGEQTALISYPGDEPTTQHVGLVRKNQTGITGAGALMGGGIIIIIEDIGNLSGLGEEAFFTLSLDKPVLLFEDGSMVEVETNSIQNSLSFKVNLEEEPITSISEQIEPIPSIRSFVDYPNDQLRVWLSNTTITSGFFELLDLQGRLIEKRAWIQDESSPVTIPIHRLASGLYLLKLSDAKGQWLQSHRIVISR